MGTLQFTKYTLVGDDLSMLLDDEDEDYEANNDDGDDIKPLIKDKEKWGSPVLRRAWWRNQLRRWTPPSVVLQWPSSYPKAAVMVAVCVLVVMVTVVSVLVVMLTSRNTSAKTSSGEPKVEHGFTTINDSTSQSLVIYHCNFGYVLPAGAPRNGTCRADGMCHPKPPACEPVTCDEPQIQHGFVDGQGFTFRNVVSYQCERGYELPQDAPAGGTCQADGQWEPKPHNCSVKSCSEPQVEHGFTTGNESTFQSLVTYHCDVGYVLPADAPTNGTCQADGMWDPKPPACEAVTCGEPQIAHGYAAGQGFTYQDVVHYQCDRGFGLPHDSPTRGTCQADGRWEPEPHNCSAVTCGEPKILNGHVDGQEFTFQEVVSYQCDEGFELLEDAPTQGTCQSDGQWVPKPPECRAVTCGEPEILNGHAVGWGFTYKTVVTYRCDKGYELPQNAPTRGTCQADRQWEPKPQNCRAISCGVPQGFNGQIVGRDYTYQAYVGYQCYGGYTFSSYAPTQGRCQANGQWEPPPHACRAINCDAPQIINGYVIGSDFSYGAYVSYQCNRGYAFPRWAQTRGRCESDRRWHPSPEVCSGGSGVHSQMKHSHLWQYAVLCIFSSHYMKQLLM